MKLLITKSLLYQITAFVDEETVLETSFHLLKPDTPMCIMKKHLLLVQQA